MGLHNALEIAPAITAASRVEGAPVFFVVKGAIHIHENEPPPVCLSKMAMFKFFNIWTSGVSRKNPVITWILHETDRLRLE
jgi:hypothetical protein